MDNLTKDEILSAVKDAVESVARANPLTSEEAQWVRMAIKAEAERAEMRKAVINKTLAGLVWLGVVAAGGWIVDFVVSHWK